MGKIARRLNQRMRVYGTGPVRGPFAPLDTRFPWQHTGPCLPIIITVPPGATDALRAAHVAQGHYGADRILVREAERQAADRS